MSIEIGRPLLAPSIWRASPRLPLPALVAAYDPDAEIFFARLATQPSAERKQLISDRFAAGKEKSFWNKLDCLWVHAAHSAQTARLNWLRIAYTCAPINNPVFTTDRGYMGDGSSSYLDTQFNPVRATSPKYTLNSGSLGVRSNTDNFSAGSLAGFYDGSMGTTINPRASFANPAMSGRINQNSVISTVNGSSPSAIGMFVVSRTASNTLGLEMYREGIKLARSSGASSTGMADGSMRLGAITDSSFRACEFSMAFIGAGLTEEEVIDIYNWFEPYRTALGIT